MSPERYVHPVNPRTVQPAFVTNEKGLSVLSLDGIPIHVRATVIAKGKNGVTYMFLKNTSETDLGSAQRVLEEEGTLLGEQVKRSMVLGVGIDSQPSFRRGAIFDHNNIGIWIRLRENAQIFPLRRVDPSTLDISPAST